MLALRFLFVGVRWGVQIIIGENVKPALHPTLREFLEGGGGRVSVTSIGSASLI
jgi:hypothetical protein